MFVAAAEGAYDNVPFAPCHFIQSPPREFWFFIHSALENFVAGQIFQAERAWSESPAVKFVY
jgi:hypothetical protein